MRALVATIQVIVPLNDERSEDDASDFITEAFGNPDVIDWAYKNWQKDGHAWKQIELPDDYAEGQAFLPDGIVDQAYRK